MLHLKHTILFHTVQYVIYGVVISERRKSCWDFRFASRSTCGHSVVSSPSSTSAGLSTPARASTTSCATSRTHRALLPTTSSTPPPSRRASTYATPTAASHFRSGASRRRKSTRSRWTWRRRRRGSSFTTNSTRWRGYDMGLFSFSSKGNGFFFVAHIPKFKI